jgi:AcrR family transcriptional regulator
MVKGGQATTTHWPETWRQSALVAIVDAAWDLVHEERLAALSLRDLASRAGVTTPTVYAYFDSKTRDPRPRPLALRHAVASRLDGGGR